MNRILVSKATPETLEQFASFLRDRVGELSGQFDRIFEVFAHGSVGESIAQVTRNLFDFWAQKSYLVRQDLILNRLHAILTSGTQDVHTHVRAALVKEFFLTPSIASRVADTLVARVREGSPQSVALQEALWACYEEPRHKFCIQSAHVFVARLLLRRIGEDKGAFMKLLSGPRLEHELRQQGPSLGAPKTPGLGLVQETRTKHADDFPAIYQLSEFDWWWVPSDKREVLDNESSAHLEELERRLETFTRRLLRGLNGFEFSDIDADVWRSVYENYLPRDERQQLGGFYTPPELVDLVLDLAGYRADREALCEEPFLDPASGSGTFVVEALMRLLQHLDSELACHAELNQPRLAGWKRSEMVLDRVQRALHAIDLHPFAAFLTTANVIFLLLNDFVAARLRNPNLPLNLSIFATDSLIKERTELDLDAFKRVNARIQLTMHSFDRYEKMLKTPFRFVFGNPPWGGVLKGPLSPVFDEHKKKYFKRVYPTAAVGKYDIYGLFFARGIELLDLTGVLALLTQNTFLEKEWASDLRSQFAAHTNLRSIVDLGPYGHLFFRAMNSPCITVLELAAPDRKGMVHVALAKRTRLPRLAEHKRRAMVAENVRRQMAELESHTDYADNEYCEAFTLPREQFCAMSGNRWHLAPLKKMVVASQPGLPLTEILEPRQGLTPGGALDIFLITDKAVEHAELETELVYRAFKTREIDRWWVQWKDRCLLYPYLVVAGELQPAFTVTEKGRFPQLQDALNFTVALDAAERALMSADIDTSERLHQLLEHRIALGLIAFPNVARYLLGHYKELEARIFKKKRLETFGREWYEYLWPRGPALLQKPRVVCPRLLREVRFALETQAYLSDDACVFLLPTQKTETGFSKLRDSLSRALGSEASNLEVLHYVLGFLNTGYVQSLLSYGRRPTPKGFYAVNEKFLSEIRIPFPTNPAAARLLVDTVGKLADWVPELTARRNLEEKVDRLARELLTR